MAITESMLDYGSLSFREKFLVGQKIFRIVVFDAISSYRDAFLPVGIEEGEGLFAYLGRRAEERKKADDAQLCSYIIENEIGPIATREVLQLERIFQADPAEL